MSCLYCGKKRGLALFKKDGFCSAEHRQLWEERESSNLVQRLIDTPAGGESQSLRLPKRPSADPAATDAPSPPTTRLLDGATPAQPPSSNLPSVISRQPNVAPPTKPAEAAPLLSVNPQAEVVRRVTRLGPVEQPPQTTQRPLPEPIRLPAGPNLEPAALTSEPIKPGGCLYCGKKRGLGFFKKDDFCSAEHRRLWQERESLSLIHI